MAEACHRKLKSSSRIFMKPRKSTDGLSWAFRCVDGPTTAVFEHLGQASIRLASTSIVIPICFSVYRGQFEVVLISAYVVLISLLVLLFFSPPLESRDWVVDIVPMWLGGILSVVAPACLALGPKLLSAEITLLAVPSTVAWVVALQTEARVLRIRSANPSVKVFARATKSIRTWAASWLVCVLVLSFGLIYYSVTPIDFDFGKNWVMCSATSAALFSSLAKLLGEAKSEELEFQPENLPQFQGEVVPLRPNGILQVPYVRLNIFSYGSTFLILILL